jgi:hypothetical protein
MNSNSSGRRPGRPEAPIPDGPFAALARALRDLRDECHVVKYESLEKCTEGVDRKRLAETASGKRLPPWPHVRAYVQACWEYAGIEGEIGPWEQLYLDAGGDSGEPAGPAPQPGSAAAAPSPALEAPATIWSSLVIYPPLSPPPRRVRGRRPGGPKLALGLLGFACLVVFVLAWPSHPASPSVVAPRTAWCGYVTVLSAPVLSAPSAGARLVKLKRFGDGIEVLPLKHPPGWWPVYTPHDRPAHNWMSASVLSPPGARTRSCLAGENVPAVTETNSNLAEEQFAASTDCHLYHRWQPPGGGSYGLWSLLGDGGWSPLGGCAAAGREFAVGMNGDGELAVFVIWSDHSVWYTSQSQPGRGPWHHWTSLGGDVSTGLRFVSARTGSWPIRVCAADKGGHLWQDEAPADGAWSGWHEVRRC